MTNAEFQKRMVDEDHWLDQTGWHRAKVVRPPLPVVGQVIEPGWRNADGGPVLRVRWPEMQPGEWEWVRFDELRVVEGDLIHFAWDEKVNG